MNTEIKILNLGEVDSTNKFATENFEKLENMTLVTAESQTAGKGRLGRKWVSPASGNFYGSLVLKEYKYPPQSSSWASSLAVINTLRENYPGLDLWLKWPNDIFCGTRKICGILSEITSDSQNNRKGVVNGMGINLNMNETELETVGRPATSVYSETGKKVNLSFFAKSLCRHLNKVYSTVFSAGIEDIYLLWKNENIILEKEIDVVTQQNEIISGTVENIGRRGELILNTSAGTLTLWCGDVSIKNFMNYRR
jgi:BirA family biotin operon repressor/biotin-[acetyl-CoA-carboxylase] ligase